MYNMIFLAAVLFGVLKGVALQPLPWPPLVTSCEVMPLIAADMTAAAAGVITCASSGYPDCETINCNVVSDYEQLEIEVLPCYEYPALWFKGRDINGTDKVYHIFEKSSEKYSLEIAGEKVTLEVFLTQRSKLTLGVEVNALWGGKSVKLIPYRDIPLNTSFCPPAPTPLTCEVLQYIEQYVIVHNAARFHDSRSTPQCPRPDTAHCSSVKCVWPPGPLQSQVVELELLPCSQPPGVRISVSNSELGDYFKHTFLKSEIIRLRSDVTLNVTLTHPDVTGVVGLEVIEMDLISHTDILDLPYVRIPLPKCAYHQADKLKGTVEEPNLEFV